MFQLWQVPTLVSIIVVAGALTRYVFLHSLGNLKGAQNIRRSVIREYMGHNTTDISLGLQQPRLSGKVRFVLEAAEVIPVSNTQGVSGEFGISQFNVVHHLQNLSKSIRSCRIIPHFTEILQNL